MPRLSARAARLLFTFAATILAAWDVRAQNYSDLWWNPAESGWGVTIADHETQLFAVWYTYQSNGTQTWFVIPGGTFTSGRRFFSGDVYQTTGPSYDTQFDPARVVTTKVGSAAFDFAPTGLAPGVALFTWTVGTTTRSKQIQRQGFGNAPPDWANDATDIWWNASESGWGLSLAQHGNNVFGAWFTYGAGGQPVFVVLPSVTFSAPDTFTGALYTTTGPAYTNTTFDPSQVHVTQVGNATIRISGSSGTFTSMVNGVSQTKNIVRQPFGLAAPSSIGKFQLATRGVWAVFDRRGYPNGYWSGDAVRMLNQFDQDLANSVGATNVAPTVASEIAAQMTKMQAMGINNITFELRATDPVFLNEPFAPPDCNLPPSLGFLWPQPTAQELANLPEFLDLAQAHGMKVSLILNNTHMEEQPPTNASTWLGAIFRAVKDHPALDAFIMGGSEHVVRNGSTSSCGIPAEAPLWLGATSYAGTYIQWAIGYGVSLGVAPRKLSAEAVVGDYFVNQQPPAGSEAQASHLWSPIAVLKQLFDNLGIDSSQRTYVLSYYSHRKCFNPNNFSLACVDADPHSWADQTLSDVRGIVGNARVIAVEFGNNAPSAAGWTAPLAFESLTTLMAKYGVEAGGYWISTETDNATEADPARPGEPIRKRGLSDVYNPVQKELLAAYGFQLPAIANPSFEDGGAMPNAWSVSGTGTASRYRLADETGQPPISSRGSYVLRLVSGASDSLVAASDAIAASPNVAYTTTANLRFQWSGDSRTGIADPSRPNVYMSIRYFRLDGSPSAVRAEDVFRYYQENGTGTSFGTFPAQYTTPADARSVKIAFGVVRNGLAQPITLDVDNVR